MVEKRPLLLGVDGGGTKTEAWLAWSNQNGKLDVIARTRGGPGNVKTSGLSPALENIKRTIVAAFSMTLIEPAISDVVCLSLAGASDERDQSVVMQWALDNRFASKVIVATDADALLAAKSKQAGNIRGTTIGLISGTGSIACGHNYNGFTAKAGGWGPVLGDEGSAYNIGLSGLRIAIQSAECRKPASLLLPAILESLQLDCVEELRAWCNQDGGQRERIASIAPIVFDQANSDSSSREIVANAASDLTAMIKSVAHSLNCNGHDFALVATGGVILGQTEFANQIMTNLEHIDCSPTSLELIPHPVVGALNIANDKLAPG